MLPGGLDVLEHADAGEGHGLLEAARDAEARDLGRRRAGDVVALPGDAPRRGRQRAGDDVEERGLARAVGPDDAQDLIEAHVDVDPGQCHDAAEFLLEAADLERHQAAPRARRPRPETSQRQASMRPAMTPPGSSMMTATSATP